MVSLILIPLVEQYHDVLRADVLRIHDVHHDSFESEIRRQRVRWGWAEDIQADKKISVATIVNRGPSKVTVMSYSGPEAYKAWRHDFELYSRCESANLAQLFAINRSKIPLLVFHGDLLPLAHFQKRIGGMGQMYLETVRKRLGCWYDELWMDPARGVLCRGPMGPSCVINHFGFDWKVVPSDVELLKNDVLIRYLSSLSPEDELDLDVLQGLAWQCEGEVSDSRVQQPVVMSSLTDTYIAAGGGVWEGRGCLGARKELENGLTRFKLEPAGQCRHLQLDLDWEPEICTWIAQSSSVLHAHQIPLEGDLSSYGLIVPAKLAGTLSKSKAKRKLRQQGPSIYLFIRPASVTRATFWSFDEIGDTSISDSLCKYLGLPLCLLASRTRKYSWSTQVYQTQSEYQVMRGWDPATTEFSSRYELPIYKIISESAGRFVNIDTSVSQGHGPEGRLHAGRSLRALFEDIRHEGETTG
ncbi:hypothetical protein AAF712_006330 [Marasmius tenuissimus]|uniref:Uncharacterized protein n=1 Tax=Marasmius tenuissimus TaxID=585030 RepID=A0ABR2ZZM6_9AGAR